MEQVDETPVTSVKAEERSKSFSLSAMGNVDEQNDEAAVAETGLVSPSLSSMEYGDESLTAEKPKARKFTKTYEEKYKIIQFSEANPSIKRKELSELFNVPMTTLCDMFFNKDKIFQAVNLNSEEIGKLKRLKGKTLQNANLPCEQTGQSEADGTMDDVNQTAVNVADSSNGSKRQRKTMTYQEKYEILKFCEANPGLKKKEIAAQFNITHKAVFELLNSKDKVLETYHAANNAGLAIGDMKRVRSVCFKNVDTTLIAWYREQRQQGVQVSSKELLVKARSLAQEFGETASVSQAWIERFKRRWKISKIRNYRRRSRSSAAVGSAAVGSSLNMLNEGMEENSMDVESDIRDDLVDESCEHSSAVSEMQETSQSQQWNADNITESFQVHEAENPGVVKFEVICNDASKQNPVTPLPGQCPYEDRPQEDFTPVCDSTQHSNFPEPDSCGDMTIQENHDSSTQSGSSRVPDSDRRTAVPVGPIQQRYSQNTAPTIREAFQAVNVLRQFCLSADEYPHALLKMSQCFDEFITKEAERRVKMEHGTDDLA